MKITVKYFASVREIMGTRSEVIDVPENTSLATLWQEYLEKQPRLAQLGLAFSVNHKYANLDQVLREGDEVAFIPPVSGG